MKTHNLIIYECEYCGLFRDDWFEMERHEKNCSFNPINKRCQSCKHAEYEYSDGVDASGINCLIGKISGGGMFSSTPYKWCKGKSWEEASSEQKLKMVKAYLTEGYEVKLRSYLSEKG